VFVRKKQNPSSSTSVLIVDKPYGQYKVVKTVGCSKDSKVIAELEKKAHQEILKIRRQPSLPLLYLEQQQLVSFLEGVNNLSVKVIGPELILGKIFDRIGLNQIEEELFRHLVVARIAYPGSKLRTVDYFRDYLGVETKVEKIYRLMDKISKEHQKEITQAIFNHSKKILGGKIRFVFYDITTLYYEASTEDDLRRIGYSKDGKFNRPQILLALVVGEKGAPLAYAVFEGNKFEGHTLLPVLEEINQKFSLPKATVVADSAILSKENLQLLKKQGYEYILGARIRNESEVTKQKILKHDFSESLELKKGEARLIVSYSEKRARKDARNRQRGVRKLQEKMKSGRLTKQQVNNHGYNKFLKLEGEIRISIDQEKIEADEKWDGLKGYLTNSSSSSQEIIDSYSQLWEIEKAFRISKTDLMIRPIYHRRKERIGAHICIAFAAYAVYKELERVLANHAISPQVAAESLRTIYEVRLKHAVLPEEEFILRSSLNPTQKTILEIFD